MDHVSRPLLVVLAGVVLLAGAWFTVLRPKPGAAGATSAPVTAPGTAGLGRAVDHAKGAVATSQHSAARAEAAAGQAPTTAAKPHVTAAKPAAKPVAKVPAHAPSGESGSVRVMNALLHGRSVVLLFAGTGADDQVAREVVKAVHGPKVETIVASINDLANYAAVTNDVHVLSAPTILVIGPNRQAQEIDGLPDISLVRSALIDARGGK